MKKNKYLAAKITIALCSFVLQHTTLAQPSISVGISVPVPSISIHAESDFYEPLAASGRWEVVGGNGRCWIPGGVEVGWRPYCQGSWQMTDAGWYWASDEPWAWATYHYGRWEMSADFGWYWVPQTEWAPAWVSWRSGGGYVGWAPMGIRGDASIEIGGGGGAFMFVHEGNFLQPVSRSSIIINTTIINQTVNVRNNEGPARASIEKASGRKIQVARVQDVRHKEETTAAAKQRPAATAAEKNARTPERATTAPAERKPVATHEPSSVEKSSAPRELAKPAPIAHEARTPERTIAEPTERKPVAAHETQTKESKPEDNRSSVAREPAGAAKVEKPAPIKKAPRPEPAKEKPDNEKGESGNGQKQ